MKVSDFYSTGEEEEKSVSKREDLVLSFDYVSDVN